MAEPSIVAHLRLADAQSRRAAGQPVASVDEPALAITA
jgi:hypothetical protein